MNNLNAITTIAFRDFLKLTRDKGRLASTFIFPLVFVGILGNSLQANLGSTAGYNFLTFVLIGTIGQTLFQSTASGLISLIEDRENDFSQEIFVAPISRYAIVLGKILGETLVSMTQLVGILLMGLFFGVTFNLSQLLTIFPASLAVCLFGGAFGLLVMTNLKSQRAANQVFPFLILPQFFLSGVWSPIKNLPLPLLLLSRIAPMTYAVDLFRSLYYQNSDIANKVVLFPLWVDSLVILLSTLVMVSIGTWLFVRNERNK